MERFHAGIFGSIKRQSRLTRWQCPQCLASVALGMWLCFWWGLVVVDPSVSTGAELLHKELALTEDVAEKWSERGGNSWVVKNPEGGLIWNVCVVPIGLSEISERMLRKSGICSYTMHGSEDRERLFSDIYCGTFSTLSPCFINRDSQLVFLIYLI